MSVVVKHGTKLSSALAWEVGSGPAPAAAVGGRWGQYGRPRVDCRSAAAFGKVLEEKGNKLGEASAGLK